MGFGRVPGAICRAAWGPFLQFSWLVLLPVVAAAILSESRSPSRLLLGPQWSEGASALPVLTTWEQGLRMRPDGTAENAS